jgi:flagellar protein FlaG
MPLKVAEINNNLTPKEKGYGAAEPMRALSSENRDATVSPSTMDTAPFDKDRLKEALKAAERLSDYSNRRLKFEYQEEADVFQVSVVDGNDEIIRKIPPDSILRMIENLKKFAVTTLDTKA